MMRRRTLWGAALVALALTLGPAAAGAAASDDSDDSGQISVTVPPGGRSTGGAAQIVNAQFKWALNPEAGAGAFAGGCNFLSAGRAGDIGAGGIVWTPERGFYQAQDGNVRIEKPDASGEYHLATWANRCLDATGAAVTPMSITQTSGNQAIIDGGTGTREDDGSLRISWQGSFTVVFYGGMTYWSASDPVLTLDASGNGQVTATASGYGASMEDLTKWEALPERSIVIAEVRGADTSGTGFATEPVYRGVSVPDAGQAERTAQNQEYWGSFPASFVQYQKLTGQAGYWLTTGGQRDRAKVPSTLYISYDARAPISTTVPPGAIGGAGTEALPSNTVRVRPPSGQSYQSVAQAAQQVAAPAAAAVYPLGDAETITPAAASLIPEGMPMGLGNLVVLGLLGILLALSVSIVAVLNIMGALPWQNRLTT